MVVRLHAMPDFENLFLNTVQFAGGQSWRRQYGLSLILGDADENVAAAQIMKIVGEGTHSVDLSSPNQATLYRPHCRDDLSGLSARSTDTTWLFGGCLH